MIPSSTTAIVTFVGLDVHAETIAVAIADPSGEVRSYGNIPAHTAALDKLNKLLSAKGVELRYVYEAGPTGFALCRHLRSKGIVCEVVSPSLVPKCSSDRVKTDRRDAILLARLFRAGELTYVNIPDEDDEAIRDLVRTRLAAVEDLRRCRQRIKGFLLRYGRRYSGKSSWTAEHLNYLSKQTFKLPAQQIAFEELVKAVEDPAARIERLTTALEEQAKSWSRFQTVQALMCLRGMAFINAVTWVAEIGDFSRFDHPDKLAAFIGITPSEDSSGQRRKQGSITKTGNEACRRAVVEAAWQYRLPAMVSPTIRARQHGQPKAVVDTAWKAQVRLCARYRHLVASRKKPVVAVTAVARELVGFIWAITHIVAGEIVPTRQSPEAAKAAAANTRSCDAKGAAPKTASRPRRAAMPKAKRRTVEYVLGPAKKFTRPGT